MKKIVGYILILLGIVMLYLGYMAFIAPPAITGVGFLLIGLVFVKNE